MESIIYSVIVPVYNVEEYLKECVESILCQRSKFSYELILVNDGSTDSSGEICDIYATDDRVQVIHQCNAGVSAARNEGIRQSRGEYILFVDGDDFWKENVLSTLDPYVEKGCDTVVFLHERLLANGKLRKMKHCLPECNGSSGKEYISRSLYSMRVVPESIWTGMYSHKVILENNLEFDIKLRYNEDFDFNMKYFPQAQSLYTARIPLYIYRERMGSATKTVSVDKLLTILTCKVKYSTMYPCTALANAWLCESIGIGNLSNETDINQLVKIIKENKHMIYKTDGRKCAIVKILYCTLGIYRGARVCCLLSKIRRCMILARACITIQ